MCAHRCSVAPSEPLERVVKEERDDSAVINRYLEIVRWPTRNVPIPVEHIRQYALTRCTEVGTEAAQTSYPRDGGGREWPLR